MTPIQPRQLTSYTIGVDLGVLVGLILISLFGPTYSDDQWIIETARELEQTGAFASSYSPDAVWVPLGQLYYFWIAFLDGLGLNFLAVRAVTATFFLFPVWLLVSRSLKKLRPLLENQKHAGISLALLFLGFVFAWGLSLRPEIAVNLFLAVAFWSWVNFMTLRQEEFGLLGAIATGLAGSAHQTGIVAASFAIAFPLVTLLRWRRREVKVKVLFLQICAGFVGFALPVLMVYDLSTWLSLFYENSLRASHSYGPLDEGIRWTSILNSDPLRSFFGASVLLFVGLTISSILVGRDFRALQVLSPVLLGPILLSLTASKWSWHVAVLLPALLISWDYLHSRAGRPVRAVNAILFATLPIPLSLAFEVQFPLGALLVGIVCLAVLLLFWGAFLRPKRLLIRQFGSLGPALITLVIFATQEVPLTPPNQDGCRQLADANGFFPPVAPIPFTAGVQIEDLISANLGNRNHQLNHLAVWTSSDLTKNRSNLQVKTTSQEIPAYFSSDDQFAERSPMSLSQIHVWPLSELELQEPLSFEIAESGEPLPQEMITGIQLVSQQAILPELSGGEVRFGMYEAFRFPCLDGLDSGLGVVEWPDFVISDRSFGDFSRGFNGAEAIAIGQIEEPPATVYLVVSKQADFQQRLHQQIR